MSRKQTEAELKVLFPFEEVTLTSGTVVVVEEWDIEKGTRATARVTGLLQKLQKAGMTGDIEIKKVLEFALPEMKALVCITLDWTEDELKQRANFTDFLTLCQAVITTSLVKPDGGGALPKIVELVQGVGLLTRAPNRSQRRSTSSSAPDTASVS